LFGSVERFDAELAPADDVAAAFQAVINGAPLRLILLGIGSTYERVLVVQLILTSFVPPGPLPKAAGLAFFLGRASPHACVWARAGRRDLRRRQRGSVPVDRFDAD
jgi:hypothetical protein